MRVRMHQSSRVECTVRTHTHSVPLAWPCLSTVCSCQVLEFDSRWLQRGKRIHRGYMRFHVCMCMLSTSLSMCACVSPLLSPSLFIQQQGLLVQWNCSLSTRQPFVSSLTSVFYSFFLFPSSWGRFSFSNTSCHYLLALSLSCATVDIGTNGTFGPTQSQRHTLRECNLTTARRSFGGQTGRNRPTVDNEFPGERWNNRLSKLKTKKMLLTLFIFSRWWWCGCWWWWCLHVNV